MKIITIISGITSILMILSMLLCGLWLKSHPTDNTSFHSNLGIATLLISLVTIILMLIRKG